MNNNKIDTNYCNICNKKYSSYKSLWLHNKKYHNVKHPNSTKNTQISIISPSISTQNKNTCKYCNKILSRSDSLKRHQEKCSTKIINTVVDATKQKELELEIKKEESNILKLKIKKEKLDLKKNKNNFESKLNLPINNHLIDIIVDKSNAIIDLKNKNTELKENIITNNLIPTKQIPPTLTLNDVIIVSRTEDNYINATHLCQAGNKKFNHWYSLDSTKQLINVLESKAGIPALELIEVNKGGNHLGSWVHPDLAIQLAQWISPIFALQVSSWIRTLFTNGNVSIDIKLLEDCQKEITLKDQKIQLLQDICIKKQKRQNYPETNIIYILSTEDNIKKRIYIIGKTKKLKDRLGPYNKTAEHGVEYYKSCNCKEYMNIAELMILSKLDKYREKANRDRFILPIDKDLSLFINIIENCINFLIL
jgi:hypothetical protein